MWSAKALASDKPGGAGDLFLVEQADRIEHQPARLGMDLAAVLQRAVRGSGAEFGLLAISPIVHSRSTPSAASKVMSLLLRPPSRHGLSPPSSLKVRVEDPAPTVCDPRRAGSNAARIAGRFRVATPSRRAPIVFPSAHPGRWSVRLPRRDLEAGLPGGGEQRGITLAGIGQRMRLGRILLGLDDDPALIAALREWSQ